MIKKLSDKLKVWSSSPGFIRYAKIVSIIILLIPFFLAFKGYFEIPRNILLAGLSFNLYGLILGTALIVVLDLFQKKLSSEQKLKLKPLLPWLIVISIVTGRLWHVATDFYLYKDNLIGILQVWKGGMSIIGFLLGLFVTLLIWGKWKKIDSLSILDKLSLYLPVGQIIGRFGNFINYELFGPPTNLIWGMFVPWYRRPQEFVNSQYFHPTFLYEIIGSILIFWILRKLNQKTKTKGLIFYTYVCLYSLVRFIVEFFRMDMDFLWNFSFNQLLMLLIFLLMGIKIFFILKDQK